MSIRFAARMATALATVAAVLLSGSPNAHAGAAGSTPVQTFEYSVAA
ncbi:hypothetical protein [Streptomyces bobili]|nr:hypothetical protein [Streptomyces bobili]